MIKIVQIARTVAIKNKKSNVQPNQKQTPPPPKKNQN